MASQSRRAWIDARIPEVMSRLQQAAGGAALCRIDGTLEGVKELEGRLAALAECKRAIGRDPQADLDEITQRWCADRDRRAAAGASQAWLDYLSGGVAELEALPPAP